jgi:hypothetical protein
MSEGGLWGNSPGRLFAAVGLRGGDSLGPRPDASRITARIVAELSAHTGIEPFPIAEAGRSGDTPGDGEMTGNGAGPR